MTKKANGEGTLQRRVKTVGGREYVTWEGKVTVGRDPGTGKLIRRSVSAATQKEALRKMKDLISRVDARTYTDAPRVTVSAWMDIWLNDYAAIELKDLTIETYKSRIETHIKPALGATKISELTVPQLQRFCNELSKRLAPKTVINIMAILQEALKQAVELGYLPINPAERVKRPRKEQKEIRPLTDREAKELMSILRDGDVTSDMITLILFTGLREGEACGLPWSAVDFERGQITVRQQLQKGKAAGSEWHLTTCKEEKVRVLTVAPSVIQLLIDRRRLQERQRHEAGMFWRNDWDLVFTQADGKYVPTQTLLKRFKKLMERIGRPDAYIHTLRHTYAVMSLQAGDDVKTVQENLGHATASFTLDVYGHVSEKMKNESAKRTEKMMQKFRA